MQDSRGSRVLAAVLVLGIAHGAAAAGSDALTFMWPDHPMQREVTGYLASSLVPIRPLPARPSLAERLEHAPFIAGEGRVALDLSKLDAEAASAFRVVAQGAGSAGQLTFPAFSPVAEKLYGPRRAPPGKLAGLLALAQRDSDPDWVPVDVKSLITRSQRRIWFHARRVLETTVTAMESSSALKFPLGTIFFAEHHDAQGVLTETHALVKRPDQEWDYLLYNAQGDVQSNSHEVQGLRSPTSCFACHRNAGRPSPFREFPDAAAAVDGFTPEVVLSLSEAEREICRAFARPGPREDHLHGVYGGIAALRLRAQIQAGNAPAWATALWPRLVRLVPALSTQAKRK